MDGILTTPINPDTRTLEEWLSMEIAHLEDERSNKGFNIHRAGQLAFARRVLDRIKWETR